MIIENLRYHILSKGEDKPEHMPQVSEDILFNIQAYETVDQQITTVTVSPQYVEDMGSQYAHIKGIVRNADGDIPCDAKYEIEKIYPALTIIGQLVMKNVIYDVEA